MPVSALTPILAQQIHLQGLDVGVEPLDFHLAALASLRPLRVAAQIDARIPPPKPGPQSTLAAALGLPEPKPGPSVGQCVEAMLLNLLSGRVALYQHAAWLQRMPCSLFWGEDISAEHFTDDRLARTLDALYEAGLDSVYTEFFSQLVRVHDVSTERLHSDGSSVSLQGAYELDEDTAGPRPKRGYSKDHHRGLQLVLGSTVQEQGIPVAFGVYDGNTSDPIVYRDHLERLAATLRSPEDTFFVGDCKLCDAITLGALRDQGLHAVTLMPKSFSAQEQLLEQALARGPSANWPLLLARGPRTQSEEDEPLVYRGMALTLDMPLKKTEIDALGNETTRTWSETWSAVVVHSSQLAGVHQKAQDKAIEKERKALETDLKPLQQMRFDTREQADGASVHEAERMGNKVRTWYVSLTIEEEKRKTRRTRPGRPKMGEAPPETRSYRVVATLHPDEEARQDDARRHGLFVLVSSRAVSEAHSAANVLNIYREQTEVEGGFRWLKAPSQLAPVLLHTPRRIAALGLLFAMALGLYRTLQMRVRRALLRTGQTMPGHHHRPTQRPSLEFVMSQFQYLSRLTLRSDQHVVGQTQGLAPIHRLWLELLGLPPDLYDDPQILSSL